MITKKQLKDFDVLLLISVFALCIIGIVSIGSATHIQSGGDPSIYNKQILFLGIGIVLMVFASIVDYQFISQMYIVFYVAVIGLLIAVLIFGEEYNYARRWIEIQGIAIQPSEFAKLAIIFCMAKIIDKEKEKVNNIFVLFIICVVAAIPIVLIKLQPSLSACLVLAAILITQLFVAGLSFKFVVPALVSGTAVILFVLWDVTQNGHQILGNYLEPYQVNRILALIYPNDPNYRQIAHQAVKSMEALGSGQLMGKGLYQGTLNQLSYLPEPHNDFIFAVIGEEFGFVGCAIVLALMLIVILRCLLIANRAVDFFSKLVVSGVCGMLAFQTFVNVGVATGLLPTTGMGLPFVSAGGSALWTNMMAIGLVLNIGMRRPKSFFEGE